MNMETCTTFGGKIAVVTGAGRGIGLAIARTLARRGARVILVDVSPDRGLAAVEQLRFESLQADFLALDLSKAGAGRALVDRVTEVAGGLDILINNARAGGRLDFMAESEENWNLAHDVGPKAAFFATQAATPIMQSRGGGVVVNIASIAAEQVTIEAASYHASKAALLHLTRYLAVAAGPFGVRVNAVLPGFIVQDEHQARFTGSDNFAYREMANSYHPLGQVGSEDDVADAVCFLCHPETRFVSGACLTLDGGAGAQEPFGLMLRRQNRKVVA